MRQAQDDNRKTQPRKIECHDCSSWYTPSGRAGDYCCEDCMRRHRDEDGRDREAEAGDEWPDGCS